MKIKSYNYNEIDLDSWKETIPLCDEENKDKIVKDINNWNKEDFSHLIFYEILDNNEVVTRCMLNKENRSICCLVTFERFRNKGYAKKIIRHIALENKNVRLFTRKEYVINICNDLGFSFFGNTFNDFGNIESEYIFIRKG